MKKKSLPVLILFMAFGLTNCTHYYYVPVMMSVPLFREQNEYRVAVATGKGDESSTAEVQAAYAISGHMAIMSSFMYAKGGERADIGNWARGTCFDGALGYFNPVGTYWSFELYGGMGISSQHHQYAYTDLGTGQKYYDGTADLSFTKLFVQPSIGLTSKFIDIALSTRLSRLNFYDIHSFPIKYGDAGNIEIIVSDKSPWLFEPAITFRVGWKSAKVQVQYIQSLNITNTDMKFEQYKYSVGLNIALTRKNRKE